MIIINPKEDFGKYQNKLVLTNWQNRNISFFLQGDKLIEVDVEESYSGNKSCLNNIYVGKVKNVAKQIQAAFVEYEKDVMGYLPLEQVKNPILTNRKYDGRIVAGDELLVQVMKDPVKTKDAILTTNLSLSGTYLAVTVGKSGVGYSNKLTTKQKNRIKRYLEANPFPKIEMFGVVIRTNSEMLTKENVSLLVEEYLFLTDRMEHIMKIGMCRPPFSILEKTESFFLKAVRNTYLGRIDRIVTDMEDVYQEIKENSLAAATEKLSLYQDNMISLRALYSLTTKMEEAIKRKVWLKSGGYLIIEPTEALTVIDVNSGKCSDKRERETYYFELNKEAAIETARQLRLRNLSGIIIVDFINMEKQECNEQLLALLRQICKDDPVRTTVVDMTALGLVEMTRKKISAPLYEKWK